MTRLVKIGNQMLPLKLRSVAVEDGEIIPTNPDYPMTYRAPVTFSFEYLNSTFVVRFLEIGSAARVKVTGHVAQLPPRSRKDDRNRVLALMDIIADDVNNGLNITMEDHVTFYAETNLDAPISAERLMVALTKILTWHKPFLQLLQEQATIETA